MELTLPGRLSDETLRHWTTNSEGWRTETDHGEPVLALPDNKVTDWRRGTVAIAGEPSWKDYEFSCEIFVFPVLEARPTGAWPGVVFRAQDTENYELVWFMPLGSVGADNVTYLSVAHGSVPWWTDAYVNNPRGSVSYDRGEWLPVRVRVRGLEAAVYVPDVRDPVLSVRLTYYLDGGRVGVYCGTETSAKFRRFRIQHFEPALLPDPPTTATPRASGGTKV